MTREVRILLVDDHALVREGLQRRLEAVDGFSVVGTGADAAAAVRSAAALEPDIVLMDIDMPGMGAFEAARMIQRRRAKTRVIFLSAFSTDRYVEAALSIQAAGYVTKGEPPRFVVDAVRAVTDGGVYFSPEVQKRIAIDGGGARPLRSSDSRLATLTARELEVLRLIARGMARKEIAEVMHVSVRTVECHCTNLMTKLNIHDRVHLARFAIREGLVGV